MNNNFNKQNNLFNYNQNNLKYKANNLNSNPMRQQMTNMVSNMGMQYQNNIKEQYNNNYFPNTDSEDGHKKVKLILTIVIVILTIVVVISLLIYFGKRESDEKTIMTDIIIKNDCDSKRIM